MKTVWSWLLAMKMCAQLLMHRVHVLAVHLDRAFRDDFFKTSPGPWLPAQRTLRR